MNKIVLLIAFSCVFAAGAFAQKKLCIAFYNQENLFDTIDDPHKDDNEFLPDAKKQWNTEKYTNKINHMAKVIASMNDNKAPDVLGMCEVENDVVLKDLTADVQLKGAKYKFAHFESPDARSIDNALLYKPSVFKFISAKAIPVTFPDNPNIKTRDILMVKLETKNKQQIIFLVNHFPSRLGGESESEFKRFHAAQILRDICDSLYKINANQHIVMMGDFNDEPTNRSIDSVLRAKGSEYDLNNGNVYNAMAELKQNGQGSHMYQKHWSMLDQIILSHSLVLGKQKVVYETSSATIYKQPWMLETEEKYKGAPLRTFAGNKYLNGYSDHLPVYIYLDLK